MASPLRHWTSWLAAAGLACFVSAALRRVRQGASLPERLTRCADELQVRIYA